MEAAAKTPALRIRLLGDFSLVYGDTPVAGINSPRLHSMLAYLVLHREAPQLRRQLAFQFWPDAGEAQARANLRQLIFELRRAVPDSERFLYADSSTLGWRTDSAFALDVAEFETSAAGHTPSSASGRRCYTRR